MLSGLNRISHPDWVKICVDPNGHINLRAKQKYEILSATICSNCVMSCDGIFLKVNVVLWFEKGICDVLLL